MGIDLSRLKVGGDFVSSLIRADGDLNPANLLTAQTIGAITIQGSVQLSSFLAGDNNPDVQVGKVSVGRDWIASSLIVGLPTGSGGDPAILASVASIVIKGHAFGTAAGSDQFIFFAERIAAFKSGGAVFPMTAGADVFNLGPTFDLTVRDFA